MPSFKDVTSAEEYILKTAAELEEALINTQNQLAETEGAIGIYQGMIRALQQIVGINGEGAFEVAAPFMNVPATEVLSCFDDLNIAQAVADTFGIVFMYNQNGIVTDNGTEASNMPTPTPETTMPETTATDVTIGDSTIESVAAPEAMSADAQGDVGNDGVFHLDDLTPVVEPEPAVVMSNLDVNTKADYDAFTTDTPAQPIYPAVDIAGEVSEADVGEIAEVAPDSVTVEPEPVPAMRIASDPAPVEAEKNIPAPKTKKAGGRKKKAYV